MTWLCWQPSLPPVPGDELAKRIQGNTGKPPLAQTLCYIWIQATNDTPNSFRIMTQPNSKQPTPKWKTAIADALAVTLVGSLSILGYVMLKNHLRPLATNAVESIPQLFKGRSPASVDPVDPVDPVAAVAPVTTPAALGNGLTNESSADQPVSVDPVAAVAPVAPPAALGNGLTNESSADQPVSVDPVAAVAPGRSGKRLDNESSVSVASQLEAPSAPLSPARPQFTRLQASGCAGPASCYMSRQR